MTQPTTEQGDTPIQIYVPALCRERVPSRLPEPVLTLDPGLPQTAKTPGAFHPQTYPFSRDEAVRVLDELLSVGETLGMADRPGSRTAANHAAWAASQPGGALQDAEKADLARFAAQEPPPPVNPTTNQTTQPENAPVIASQKILLLAWDLERRLAEIAALRRQVAEAVKPLTENLHGGEAVDPVLQGIVNALPGALPESLDDLPESVEPDWRLTLAAIAAFVPGNAIFVTAHEGIRSALSEGCMLHPLPPRFTDKTAPLPGWGDTPPTGALWAKAPLWRVIGRPHEPVNSPWLCPAREIIVLLSEGS